MTLRRRLNKLENELTSVNGGDLRAAILEHARTLCDILGRVDALWWPIRAGIHSRWRGAVIERQREYRRFGGIPYSSGGRSDSTKWKSDERLRKSMRDSGLITISKKSGQPRLQIVPHVEVSIRQGILGLDWHGMLFAALLQKVHDDNDLQCRKGGWVSEVRAFGSDYKERPHQNDWFADESKVLPLLIGGHVETETTTTGHIYYRTVRVPDCDPVPVELDYDEALADVYLDSWLADHNGRVHWAVDDPYEVFIPLPASK